VLTRAMHRVLAREHAYIYEAVEMKWLATTPS
jgi:hypothetical protein